MMASDQHSMTLTVAKKKTERNSETLQNSKSNLSTPITMKQESDSKSFKPAGDLTKGVWFAPPKLSKG
jgi:hypothetical protein